MPPGARARRSPRTYVVVVRPRRRRRAGVANADDYEAIRALIHEYCFRIDSGDLDGLAALFDRAELGSSVRPERMRGREEARHYYDGVILYDDGTPQTMHCITNTTIAVV